MDNEFEGFPYLLRADLFIYYENPPLCWFHNIKFLYVALWSNYEYGKDRVPTFPNLTHMELVFQWGCGVWKYKWVIEVLQHCPKLQNLIIAEAELDIDEFENGDFEKEELEEVETVPECLLSQLRTCAL